MSSEIFTSRKIDPHKASWDINDWHIYINNLEILCLKHDLRKKDFSRRVQLANAFRTDAGKPSSETIKRIAKIFGKTPEWLLTYREKFTQDVNEASKEYDLHGGWKPRSIEEMAGVPDGLGMGRAVEMLAKIYQSKNKPVISAIFANLRVFCERVDQEEQIKGLQHEVDELRQLFKNHAKVHGYYGEDRRSGDDRRKTAGPAPEGIERRSGIERRQHENGEA